MENIVRLAAYRSRRKARAPLAPPPQEAPRYYCTRCDTDQFRLCETGTVHCAHCGALMRNIIVNRRP